MRDEQKILTMELRWGAVVSSAIAVFIAVIVVSSFVMAMHPPSHVETIDPTTLHLSGEFVEANLGTTVAAGGQVTARIVAAQFAFLPQCVAVPQGRPVTLRFASPDVIHGIIVVGTNVNTMVVPGYVSEIHTRFAEAGDHLMPCHEFCGLGHSEMLARIRVLPQVAVQAGCNGKVSCGSARRLILAHLWPAFAVFAVAAVLGAWQMWVRSPLEAPFRLRENYYISVTAHGTVDGLCADHVLHHGLRLLRRGDGARSASLPGCAGRGSPMAWRSRHRRWR